ncbi:hypothetical protein Rhe02_91510 [Rhizocola hellebori]|uniref:EcsC family protein n=1 Tax=Rhizocola hellebori TaxID=1392758 RepID=A0A8J3QH88_9ACTN|nr:hypothetical protein [Rhizocola hellebori]GIH11084.1 hypothetical protein Rhe02_91510 [Rhizocola hellebori]
MTADESKEDRKDDLALAVAGLAESEMDKASRARLLARLVGGLKQRGVGQLFQPRKAMQWIADAVSDLAPHVPVRTIEVLRAHYPGLEGEALAERLIRNAARATASVGAAGGGLASVEWAAPPMLLTTPVLLATETVAVVAIEMKLIGELHEVYGHTIPGSGSQKAVSLMQGWSSRRGVNPMLPGSGLATVLSTATRKQMRDMLLKRFGRNLTTLGPLLTGAAVASFLNQRATKRLGEEVSRDLRLRHGKPALPPAE